VPASGEAAQVLGGHLAGLNNYLSEHHGESAMVTMAASEDGRSEMGAHQGERQSPRHEPTPGREDPPFPTGASARTPPRVSASTPARAVAGGGRYISVMA
jgi:hypothetical protein